MARIEKLGLKGFNFVFIRALFFFHGDDLVARFIVEWVIELVYDFVLVGVFLSELGRRC